jgi:hypothetical protein
MAQTDDRDPGDEVEILATGIVPDATSLPPHDSDVGAGVGREHRIAQR